ncbi:uncharacterized protein LOC128677352 isoform X2 [Plodia interpunctella]|uniref:uncharacterized protein LOC128677352 isoform X2 n=1 Tax=Plodia interpunctella TaxID=58824 RepID=UPI002367BBD3|nr:uncharacterized protein LOC128677352 isoform X2 [Plodia interpunctella]
MGSAYDLRAVEIRGCGTRLPCLITLGEMVPVVARFQAGFTSRNLNQDVVISINYVNMRTQVTPESCVQCAVSPNVDSSMTSLMMVPTIMALNQRGYLQWRVFNEHSQQVLCYSVLVQTQNPLQKLLRRSLNYTASSIDESTKVQLNHR